MFNIKRVYFFSKSIEFITKEHMKWQQQSIYIICTVGTRNAQEMLIYLEHNRMRLDKWNHTLG